VLPVVSANLGGLDAHPKLVTTVVSSALDLARGALANHINGANLTPLIEHLLTRALWGELDLDDAQKLAEAARQSLRAA